MKHNIDNHYLRRSGVRDIKPKLLIPARIASGPSTKPARRSLELFKKAVKGRPTDVSWVMRFGQLGRSMGLSFDEALSVILPHYRKLKGNTRRSWIEKGLKLGFAERGLRA